MKRVALALLLLPALALANVSRTPPAPPQHLLWSFSRNNTIAATAVLGGTKLPTSRGVAVVAARMNVSVASGGGAGTTIIRVCTPNASGTCGASATNICTATFACTDTAVTQAVESVLTGTCSFTAGAKMAADIQASTCTTSQGSIHHFDVLVNWQ